MAKTRNLWDNATKELVETSSLELQDFMAERGFDLDDYLYQIQLDPKACIDLCFTHKAGYIRPLKIRDTFAATALWLYKDYCQEEPAPDEYHTVKICTTGGCVQPHHYIEVPRSVSVQELKTFLDTALGRYWYEEYLRWGTWAKAWAAAWEAMEASPINGIALLHTSTGKFKGHEGLATDIEALKLIKSEFNQDISIFQWQKNAAQRYHLWIKHLRATRETAPPDLDVLVNTLTEEQKLILLNKLQVQQAPQVVAPFEEV